MVRNIFSLFLGFLLYTSCVHGQVFEAEARYWLPDFSADVSITKLGVAGTDVDLKNDLGIGDENLPEVRFTLHITPRSWLRLAYTQAGYSGSEVVSKNVVFNGRTYTAGTRVDSDFEFKYARLGWGWEWFSLFGDWLRLGTLFEIKGIWSDASLVATSLGFDESEELIGALPTAGLIGNLTLGPAMTLFAEASGISLGSYGYVVDGEVGLKILPVANTSIVAGYRILQLKIEDDPDYAEAKVAGFFAGITFEF